MKKQLLIAVMTVLVFSALPGLGQDRSTPSLTRFEGAIKAFEARDAVSPPPAHPTVFVGSSTITFWRSLEKEFTDFNAINRGFGGSTIPEVNHYLDRVVIKYKPDRVVFYTGSNDIASGRTGEQVCKDFIEFDKAVASALPHAEVYFISLSTAPSRARWATEFDSANRQILSFIERTPHTHFIDVRPAMLDSQGHIHDDYFLPDRLHMTAAGYASWTPIIRKALQQKISPKAGASK